MYHSSVLLKKVFFRAQEGERTTGYTPSEGVGLSFQLLIGVHPYPTQFIKMPSLLNGYYYTRHIIL